MILSLFALVLSFEASAQRRRIPNNPNRPVIVRPGPVIVNPGPSRRVGPRYVPNSRSRRVYRSSRRPTVIWDRGFNYYCSYSTLLDNNGFNSRPIHNFNFSSDCQQALADIRDYGDFCDNEDLYDQSGILEAQFTFNYECRNALGWYY